MSYDAIWYHPYDGLCHMYHLQESQTSLRNTYRRQHHLGFPELKVCVATVVTQSTVQGLQQSRRALKKDFVCFVCEKLCT